MRVKKVLALAPLQIAQALVGFGAIAAFTRLMSPEEFGQYALALSVSMFAHTLVFTAAEAAAFRFFASARASDKVADHFATLLTLALALAAGVVVVTLALLTLLGVQGPAYGLAFFAAGSAAFRFLTKLARESDRAALDTARFAIFETAYLVLGFGAGVALLSVADFGAAAPFAGLMIAGVIVFAADAPRLLTRAKDGVISTARAGNYLAYGAPLALALAVDLGVQALARIILAERAGAAELGAFAAAFGLARPLDLIFMSAGAAIAPLILTAYEADGAAAARKAAKGAFTAIAAITFPAAAGLLLLAQPLSDVLVGSSLSAEAASVTPWLVLAGLFSGFNLYYWSEAFQLTRRTGLRALIMLAPGALQIGLTLVLTQTNGAIGAAIAAAIGAGAGGVLLALIGRRLFAPPIPWSALARICIATAIMALAITALPNRILSLSVVTGVFTYGAAAIALDLFGARKRASAVLQTVGDKLRGVFHASFTDRANVRR